MYIYLKKSKIIWLGLAIILVAALVILNMNTYEQSDRSALKLSSNNQLKYVVSQAKGIKYGDFEQLNMDSEIVIQGTKTGVVKEILQKNEVGQILDQRTLSSLSIIKVLRDGSNKLQDGANIVIQENAVAEGKIVYSTAGYQLMNDNEDYLLFLRASLTKPDVYIIKGIFYGKIPLHENDNLQYQGFMKFGEESNLHEIYASARKYFNL